MSPSDTNVSVETEEQIAPSSADAEQQENIPIAAPGAAESDRAPKPELFGFETGTHNLGLLLDLKLEATIRFGQRELLLRDVLSLAPGAVVELDRQVNEPAELLVAGKLVARGEVVVVDGNFGLKISELLSRSDRAGLVRG
jgi:flagellar motor switch protein FliN